VTAVQCVEYKVNRRPVSVCVREDAADPDSLAIRRRDPSIFLEFADVAPYAAPGSTVLDLGTHIGVASLYFLALGHPVTSFEPSPGNVRLLTAAHERNAFEAWTIEPVAVGERSETLTFFSDGPHGHIVRAEAPIAGAEPVRAVSLDDWLRDHPPAVPIGMLKIDVEGAEVGVLNGAQTLLSRPDAPPLFIESNGHCLTWFGQTPTTLREAIAAYGYHLFGVLSKRPFRPTAFYPVEPQALQTRCVINYFCVKDVAAFKAAGARIVSPPSGGTAVAREIAKTLGGNADERAYMLRTLPQFPDVADLPAVRELVRRASG
jgi:FkbM family methyltransferase